MSNLSPKATVLINKYTPGEIAEQVVELEEAAKLMFRMKIKKLPVVKNGQLKGLVTLTDLARCQPQMIRLLKKLSRKMGPKRMQKVVNYYVV